MAHFVLYLLRYRAITLYYFDPVVKIVRGLMPFPNARNDLQQICQQLAELGYQEAGALRNSILGDYKDGDPNASAE